jgi:HK97 gp10 family phage protein
MADFELKGMAELQKIMDELPAKIEKNILAGALRAAGNVIADEARSRAPFGVPSTVAADVYGAKPGSLRDSVRVSMRTSNKTGQVRASVKAGDKVAYYAHWVEFGTARHWILPKNRKSLVIAGIMKEKVEHPGARPKPFMRRAFDTKAQAALDAMADYIRTRLPKEVAKQGGST